MIIFLRISGSPDFKLISKFMTSRPGSETSAIQIFPNISRSKGNPTIKFGQLKECNMRNTLLKNHTLNLVEKLFLDPFLRNQN